MDTRDFFPKSTPSHWYCLPLLNSIPEESRAGFLAGFCRLNTHHTLESYGAAGHQNGTLLLSKWNTHQNGILILKRNTHQKWNTPIIKMEHSYYQNGILILKRNTHQKWNTHIKKEHSYYQSGTLILKRNTHIKKEYSSKMEHSHQKCNTPIIKRNTGEKVESMKRL